MHAAQLAFPSNGSETVRVELPSPRSVVVDRLRWGDAGGLFTPAYWAAHCVLYSATSGHGDAPHRLGRTLLEEACACVLGGYGMAAETGIAAFHRLQALELIGPGVSESQIRAALSQPLIISGQQIRYRFPKQKSRYLEGCFRAIPALRLDDLEPVAMRNQLMTIRGIGPKTASWIVRNWLNSDDVAILDIHVMRAMHRLGLSQSVEIAGRYLEIESAFLRFAQALNVRASVLDAVMWQHMRRWGYLLR